MLRLEEAAARRESELGASEKLREHEWARQQVPSLPSPPSPHRHPLSPYILTLAISHSSFSSPSPPPSPSTSPLLSLANQFLLTTARSSPAAGSQQSAEPPPPSSQQWGLPEPQDFAAHRAAPRSAVCGGAGAHALPRGGSLEDAFAGGSCGSSLGDAVAGSGGSDTRQTTTSAGLRHLGCSLNSFAAPTLGALFDAAFPSPGCGGFEGSLERTGSNVDSDAAFSGVPSWFKGSGTSIDCEGAPPCPHPYLKQCYGLGPPLHTLERSHSKREAASALTGSPPPSSPLPEPPMFSTFQPIDARPSPRSEAAAFSSNPFRKGIADGCDAAPLKHAVAARAVGALCVRPLRPLGGHRPLAFGVLQPPSEAHHARCTQRNNNCTRWTRAPNPLFIIPPKQVHTDLHDAAVERP